LPGRPLAPGCEADNPSSAVVRQCRQPPHDEGWIVAENSVEIRRILDRAAGGPAHGTVDLSGRDLDQLPPELFELRDVYNLYLDGNRLTAIPPEIAQMSALRTLNLRSNRLRSLPPEMCRLRHLSELFVDANSLSALPVEISHLSALVTLNANENQLVSLPREISRLTRLRQLYLRSNRIIELPDEIGELTELQALDLADNQLAELPRTLSPQFRSGLNPTVDENPLREPYPDLIQRGWPAVADYLDSLTDAERQYEAKVMMVGEGNVGKTSLVAALNNAEFIANRATTHGIEINQLALPHPALNVTLDVRIWDFGGQEVYRITHQFFFSRRALYVLVWNSREGQEQNEVEGWLRRIRLRVGADAKVLLVATHCDERQPELDYPSLRAKFPGVLVGAHAVDNKSGRGIEELRTALAAEVATLPQIGQFINRSWLAARRELAKLARDNPQIAYDAFADVCGRNGVQPAHLTVLAELMHDLGQTVYYGDDSGLSETVVLKPEWLTKAIGYVLEDKATRDARGVLDHRRLGEIWQRPDGDHYPRRYHPYFLRLMEKFDVSYRISDQDESLVAQLVPYERPKTPWDFDSPLPKSVRALSLICRLSDVAPGLIAWLTVRHHQSSVGAHWRTGVFLRYPVEAYDSEALLEMHTETQLRVEVRAPSPDFFFSVLRDSIEDLVRRRWRGITYRILIPCPKTGPDGRTCPGQFPIDGLARYRERKERELQKYVCLECDSELDVSELLTGFSTQPPAVVTELRRIRETVEATSSEISTMTLALSEHAHLTRLIAKAVSIEVTDCPRLFTLTARAKKGRQRLKVTTNRFVLRLWCEQPGEWHPCSDDGYDVYVTKEWVEQVAPYANLLLKALRLLIPLAGSTVGVLASEKEARELAQEVDLGKALASALPAELITGSVSTEQWAGGKLTLAEGQGLRALRSLLLATDPARAFAGMRRTPAPSGEFLWLCGDHYGHYDPGLPELPPTTTP